MTRRVDIEAAALYVERSPAAIQKWVNRGKLTRHPDGFDLDELKAADEKINAGKARGAKLAAHSRHQASRSARSDASPTAEADA